MYHTSRENKRLCNSIKSRTRFSSLSLSLSLLLAVVFATSLFLLPRPSVVYAAANEVISYDPASKTVTIRGNCDTNQIYAFMHEDPQDPSSGTGKDATTLRFAGTSVIRTLQYDPTSEIDPELDKGPFVMTQLEDITADSGAQVSFVGKDSATPPTLMGFFYMCGSLSSIDGLSAWDVSKVEGAYCMDFMFSFCSDLTSLDGLSAWDVSNVKGDCCMSGMFYGCATNLTSLDGLSAWDVSNVKGDYCMASMFQDCSSLTSLNGLSAWNVSNVKGDYCMASMFQGCSSLTSLDGLSAWNVGNVHGTRCMAEMFQDCTSLTSLDGLSAWDVSGVNGTKCMAFMFNSCTSLTSLDGLSAWDVSGVKGEGCMSYMFQDCTNLTSLDGLSAWDVFNVEGQGCMVYMFYDCYSLQSIDGLASWDIQKALASTDGVLGMFAERSSATNPMSISSITVSDTFTLTDDMFKENSQTSLPSWNWWPVNAASPTAVDMAGFVTATQDTANNGYRWQRCVDGTSTSPMKDIASADAVSISWDSSQTTLVYTGLLQSVAPVVTIQGETEPLELGRDFYVVYKGSSSSRQTPAIKDVGPYSAQVILRGRYNYTSASELASQSITIQALALDGTVYAPFVYTLPNTFKYTGKEIEPKTMVRLYLRDDPNPGSTPEKPLSDIPIYTYLVQNTAERNKGDYTVSYKNNINPGTASAIVEAAIPSGLASSNLEGTSTAYFTITGDYTVTFDSNGGSAVASQEVISGHPVTKPEDPTREGYTFLYWCTDASLTDKFDFATPITHDITLYAKWEGAPSPVDTITLTFRTEEGSWAGITETTREGAPDAAIIAPVYPTVDASRTCIGWFDETGKEVVSGVTTFEEVTGTVTARFVDTPGWHQNNTGWWYVYDLNNNYYTNCWALINSAWFYFNEAGYCLEYTWGYINGAWYFFGWGGYMQTGWQWISGSWYFLDRYTGAMKCGWVHDGVWYYCDAEAGGAMYDNCWAYINGNWYGFNEGGSMTQGWSWSYAYDGWFYLQPDTGHMLYSWQYIGGHWYYFYDNGLMAANTYVGTYWLGADGAMW